MLSSEAIAEIKARAAKAISADPVAAYAFNPAQLRFFDLVRNPSPSLTIVEFLKGNGLGGSWSLIALWSAIMFGTANPNLQGRPFGKHWPFMKSARLVTTKESVTDTGPIQRAMKLLFPHGRWTQSRGAGKHYFSEGRTDTGWSWDILTYHQELDEFASHTKGVILLSEPSPESIFFEVVTRLRGRGMVLIDMTQLDEAAWNEELLTDGLKINGKSIGAEVRHTFGHHHEACVDHFPGGHRSHASIEADYALWLKQGKAFADARATGKGLSLAGRVYANWTRDNEIERLPEYHQECWNKGMVKISSILDPHDRKPWAMGWYATFPNNDVVMIAEWPSFDFWSVETSPISDIEDYRSLILETEAEIGVPVTNRFGDPEFMAAPKSGTGKSIKQMLSEPCRNCINEHGKEKSMEKCKHRLFYIGAPNAIPTGHALVRSAIGFQDSGQRPKFFKLTTCQNGIMGSRRYAWKAVKDPTKGLGEKPQLVFKDFPDLDRYLFNAGLDKWPIKREDVELFKSPYRERNTRR